MPTMPLDILFEVRWSLDWLSPLLTLYMILQIFGFMHPRDLLNLARTTRDFRTLLMSKRSASFWKEARSQVEGLPKPPYYLSEPAYANVAFMAHCSVSNTLDHRAVTITDFV